MILNKLRERKRMGEERNIISTRDKELMVKLPTLQGEYLAAQVNWIEDLGDSYFRAGLTYLGGYPYGDGSTEWILKLDPEQGFKPLFCSLYWDVERGGDL